jgi:S-adenosylmethionine:tRNA ribosyltransferase-isomerase
MHIRDVIYELPEELIAQQPCQPRDSARLLVDRGDAEPDHLRVHDIVDLLDPRDVLVVNHTRVVPARLEVFRTSGGRIEVLLLERREGDRWEALIRQGGKLREGETLASDDGVPVVRIGTRTEAGDTFMVELLLPNAPDAYGSMPLPPYITAPLADRERYQTVYSHDAKSAAAPTAGLHFTHELLDRIRAKGIAILEVELVVGLDTFKPIQTEDPLDHIIHTESYSVSESTLEACREARSRGGRVVAVGTTATRALESAAGTGDLSGRTSLFITPGYEWKIVDLMMTNFHMPKTSLILMVSAFVGPRWRQLYETAIGERYRFLSFGDAMLLDRHA